MSKEDKISRQSAVDAINIINRSGLSTVGTRKLVLALQYLLQETDKMKESVPEKRPVGRPPKKPEDIREEGD